MHCYVQHNAQRYTYVDSKYMAGVFIVGGCLSNGLVHYCEEAYVDSKVGWSHNMQVVSG